MKSVRSTIVIMTITIFAWLSLGSCNRESQTQTPEQTTEESAPSYEDIPKAVTDSISTISQELRNAVETVDNMRASITKMQGKEICLWGAIILIAVLAFVLFGICHKLYSNLHDRANRQHSDIEELKRYNQDQSSSPRTAARTSVPSDYESLKRRVCELEKQVNQLTSDSRPIKQSQTMVVPNVPKAPSPKTNGYFGNPVQAAKQPYFKKLLVSCDSDARFSVDISGDEAVFRPLESSDYIGTFISNDAMRAAIEFQGCTPREGPSSMHVNKPGKAVQEEGGKWLITEKSQVYLSR